MAKGVATLPLTKEAFQHAEHDPNFYALLKLFDACSETSASCEGCWLREQCEYIVRCVSDRCCDRLLMAEELLDFANKFMNLFEFKSQSDFMAKNRRRSEK